MATAMRQASQRDNDNGFAGAAPRFVGRALSALSPAGPVVLAYHGFGTETAANDPRHILIGEAAFRRQLEALRSAGLEFVTVSEIGDRLRSGSAVRGLAALTFDDGLASLFEPLCELAADGVPSTVYPVAEWIGGRHPAVRDPEEARILDRAQVRGLAQAGVEIGGHSQWHADLTKLSPERCLRDMVECRRTLEWISGREVRTFAYPYGRSTSATRAAAEQAGFDSAVVEDRDDRSERFCIGRIPVRRTDGWSVFALKVAGAWPAVAGSLPGRAARAATRPVRVRIHRNGHGP